MRSQNKKTHFHCLFRIHILIIVNICCNSEKLKICTLIEDLLEHPIFICNYYVLGLCLSGQEYPA